MQCPKCQSDNPGGMKFCGECGSALKLTCSQCNFTNPSGFKFYGECGGKLESHVEAADPVKATKSATQQTSLKDDLNYAALTASERKHVRVLFSDLTDYTAMSERLDPEDVKEITSRIFGEIAKIVASYDSFEKATVKGKAELVEVHKVLSEREAPVTIRRLSGVRAELVGRTVEMAELSEAVEKLAQVKGRIFSICGAAGTGKSRLVEEFKAGLDLSEIQWIACHAYAYFQDIPYLALVDLLNRRLHIKEKGYDYQHESILCMSSISDAASNCIRCGLYTAK